MLKMSKKIDEFGIPILEMARVWPEDSGINRAIVIIVGDKSHGPRIKVSLLPGRKIDKDRFVSVSISDNPEFLHDHNLSFYEQKNVIQFIKLNKNTLLDHFFGKISDKKALNYLRKV